MTTKQILHIHSSTITFATFEFVGNSVIGTFPDFCTFLDSISPIFLLLFASEFLVRSNNNINFAKDMKLFLKIPQILQNIGYFFS